MKRKVVKHGPSTFIISLPLEWVRKYGIEKGNELDVSVNGKVVSISSGEITKSLELSMDISGMAPRLVDRFLSRAYQKGYDRLYLIHNDVELLATIRSKVHELIGFEIVEQNERSCTIQSIASKINLDFDNFLRKVWFMLKQMAEDVCSAFKNSENKVLENLYLKDLEVNRMCYFCLRMINKQQYGGYEDSHQSHALYYLIETLESLGDAYKVLASQVAGLKKNRKEIDFILGKLHEQLELSYAFFYGPTKERANSGFVLFKEVEKKIDSFTERSLSRDEIKAQATMHEISKILFHFITVRLDYLEK